MEGKSVTARAAVDVVVAAESRSDCSCCTDLRTTGKRPDVEMLATWSRICFTAAAASTTAGAACWIGERSIRPLCGAMACRSTPADASTSDGSACRARPSTAAATVVIAAALLPTNGVRPASFQIGPAVSSRAECASRCSRARLTCSPATSRSGLGVAVSRRRSAGVQQVGLCSKAAVDDPRDRGDEQQRKN